MDELPAEDPLEEWYQFRCREHQAVFFGFQDSGIPLQVSKRAHFLSINWQIKWFRQREMKKRALLLAFYGALWPEQGTAVQGEEHSPAFHSLNTAALSFRKGGKALLEGSANTLPLLVYIYRNPVFLKQFFNKIIISFYDTIIKNAFAGSWLICPINIRAL